MLLTLVCIIIAHQWSLAMYYYDQLDWKVGSACSGYQLFELKELMNRLHIFFNGMKVATDKLHSCRCNDEKGIGHNEDAKKLFGDVLKRPVCNLLYNRHPKNTVRTV
jgi:hypothetical protein